MVKLIECIPNISEGKNKDTINHIVNAVKSISGVSLLNVHTGEDVNRTVFTIIGEQKKIFDAVLLLYKEASQHIDMSKHKGKHPRIGAVDVCPFVPYKNINIKELVYLTNQLALKISKQFEIPIYLYEYSQKNVNRKHLEQIRKGEYEGMFNKIKQEEWKPDFGSPTMNIKLGASVFGVRNFLIAYNINLDTKNLSIAKNIATQIRTSGGIVTDSEKKNIIKNGLLKNCKAIAWYVEDYDKIQISTNITDFNKTSIFDTFQAVKVIAEKYSVSVTGSEIVGMVPKSALLKSFDQIISQDSRFSRNFNIKEQEKLKIVSDYFNFAENNEFVLENRVLDFLIFEN